MAGGLISVEEAQARVLAMATPVASETVPLAMAAGRWAAEDVLARRTQPARDLSAMDGYAIRFADMPGPWRVVGTSAAGSPMAGGVGHGEAARIFTGAAVPEGADTILVQEEARRDGDALVLTGSGPAACASSVRKAGADFASGQSVIACGERLTPARIGLAAMAGYGELRVRRTVTVALISTGDELVPPGTEPGTDRLPSSNAVMLAAMLRELPVDVSDLGIIPDRQDALVDAFESARHVDMVVTSGGASVGDHDLVRPALIEAGASIDFWRIAMRPGKPLMAGRLGGAIVLGLPGNPVSAFVTATLFLKPLVAALGGAAQPLPVRFAAVTGAALPAVGPRTDFVRAAWQDGRLVPVGTPDSAALVPLVQADVLIVRAAHMPAIGLDTRVEAIALA